MDVALFVSIFAIAIRAGTSLVFATIGEITTEIAAIDADAGFFYAEPYHQQYLAKNPNGYCGIGGTGVSCPIGVLDDGD